MMALLFIGALTLSSCKKEVQIEKNLWKGDGVWNIDVWDEQATSTFFDDDNYTEYKNNAGTIQFNKDGTGEYKIQEQTIPMSYENTDKTLTIRFMDNGQVTEDEKQVFEMDWKKNKMDLKSFTSDTYSTGDGQGGTVNVTYTHRLNLKLTKK